MWLWIIAPPLFFFFFFFLLLCQLYGFDFCAAARSRLQARGKKFRDGIFSVGKRERGTKEFLPCPHFSSEWPSSSRATTKPETVDIVKPSSGTSSLVTVDPRTYTHGSLAPLVSLVKSFAWRGRHSNAKEPLWPSACKRAGGRVFISSSRRWFCDLHRVLITGEFQFGSGVDDDSAPPLLLPPPQLRLALLAWLLLLLLLAVVSMMLFGTAGRRWVASVRCCWSWDSSFVGLPAQRWIRQSWSSRTMSRISGM